MSEPNRMNSVLIIAYSWPPDSFVGALRPAKLAKHLVGLGWTPTIITAKEKYYERCHMPDDALSTDDIRVLRTACLPSPRLLYVYLKSRWYELLGRGRQFEEVNEGLTGSEEKETRPPSFVAYLKRVLVSLLHTPDEFLGWFPIALIHSFRAVSKYDVKCVITTGPPFTGHLVGLALKTLCRVSWVADFRDPWSWHECIPRSMRSPISDRLNATLETCVMKKADHIVCVTSAMTERYSKLFPNLDEKISTITNGFDEDDFAGLSTSATWDKFTLTYVGTFDFERNPQIILKAIGDLVSEGSIQSGQISIRFVGPCKYAQGQPIDKDIRENGLGKIVELVGVLPRREALQEMLKAHVLLLIAGQQRLTVAAKVYEYLAAGKPILALTPEGSVAEVIRGVDRGVVVAPSDNIKLKEAIRDWYRQWLQGNSLKPSAIHNDLVVSRYGWKELGRRYAQVLESCVAQHKSLTKAP